jgi:Antidote-toxin recognition MazE, bacterial antitoxin
VADAPTELPGLKYVFNTDRIDRMKRSLVQTGSSLAVTLPIEVVQAFSLKKGQEVELSIHPLSGVITICPGVALLDNGQIGDRFQALADEVMHRRAGLLTERLR